jgi:hypothetical protein
MQVNNNNNSNNNNFNNNNHIVTQPCAQLQHMQVEMPNNSSQQLHQSQSQQQLHQSQLHQSQQARMNHSHLHQSLNHLPLPSNPPAQQMQLLAISPRDQQQQQQQSLLGNSMQHHHQQQQQSLLGNSQQPSFPLNLDRISPHDISMPIVISPRAMPMELPQIRISPRGHQSMPISMYSSLSQLQHVGIHGSTPPSHGLELLQQQIQQQQLQQQQQQLQLQQMHGNGTTPPQHNLDHLQQLIQQQQQMKQQQLPQSMSSSQSMNHALPVHQQQQVNTSMGQQITSSYQPPIVNRNSSTRPLKLIPDTQMSQYPQQQQQQLQQQQFVPQQLGHHQQLPQQQQQQQMPYVSGPVRRTSLSSLESQPWGATII